jgi:hypothetical protein
MNTPMKDNDEESVRINTISLSVLETKRILEALERSDIEKFQLFTRLMRIHIMLGNAIIIKK